MPTRPPSITLDPAPHPALSYAGLRAEALELLGRLCGDQWSDFNSHDPGITILEQLCFALTELAYRSQWSIEDLLASAGADWQPAAAEILSGDPVTPDDLVALLRTLGCQAVQVEAQEEPELPLYFRPSTIASALAAPAGGTDRPAVVGDLELDAEPLGRSAAGAPQPVAPRGVWRLAAQLGTGASGSSSASLQAIARRLHGARLLGRDFRLDALVPFEVVVKAEVELHTAAVAPGLLDRLRAGLDAVISDVGASGAPGGLRSAVLIQVLQAQPEVRRVISLELASDPNETFHPWHLPLPRRGARLHRASVIRLSHRGLPLQPPPPLSPPPRAAATLPETPSAAATPAAITPGRRRSFSSPGSVARQLPAVYGVGPAGLPADASTERRGQALQLRAYLHLFDQLLANGQAQLAHAAQLLAPVPAHDPHPLDAEAVGLANDRALPLTDLTDLLHGDSTAWPVALRQALHASAPASAAHQRADLLAHLLRRFGEELELDSTPSLVLARSALLRRIVPLTAGRGSGPDLLSADPLAAPTTEASQGSFAERLRHKLGLLHDPDGTPPLLVIEHLLLRPLPEDNSQRVQGGEDPIPFLSDVTRPDPWSGRVSVVVHASRLPGTANTDQDRWLRWLVHHLRQELPAHLQAELHLLSDDPASPGQGPWSEMLTAWHRFRALLQSHRLASLSPSGAADASESQLRLLRLRDSRDRLVSLLRLGLPWPLRAIPLPEQLMVAPEKKGAITLPYSQRGIRYQLVDLATGATCGDPVQGTDDALTLTTPTISKDITLRVQASVLPPSGPTSAAEAPVDTRGVALTANGRARSTLLIGEIRVLVGIDLALPVRILDASSDSRLPLLDPNGVVDNDALARLAAYGQRLVVEIDASQLGVKYRVIDHKTKASLSDEISGNTRTLRLPLKDAAAEDQDLAVRARLEKGKAKDQSQLTALLPLRVKANPDVPLQPSAAVVAAEAEAEILIGVEATKETAAQATATYQLRTRELQLYLDNTVLDEWRLNNPLWLVHPLRPANTPKPDNPTARQQALERFPEANAGTWTVGNGKQLPLKLPIRGEGVVVAALARKEHDLFPLSDANKATLTSEVPLAQVAVVYAKPQATRQLLLRPVPDRPGFWSLEGGQPGVAYTLKAADGTPLTRELPIPEVPAALDKRQGIGWQRVGRDLVVGLRDEPARAVEAFTLDPTAVSPLKVEARYLRSGVTVELQHPPTWEADPTPAVVTRRNRKLPSTPPPPETFSQVLTTRGSQGQLELLLLGADGSVWQRSQTSPLDPWSAPIPLGGSGYQQLVAGWSRDGRQQLFAVGADQAAWHNHQIDAQAGGWAGWTSLGGSIKQLAVASNADGRLELFGIGVKNGPLWELPQTLPDDAWGTWTSLAGGITEIRAGRNSDGRVEVFAIGTNTLLYHIWQQEPGARWSGWVPLHGNLLGMDLQTNADGRFQVFAIGSDHALWHIWQTQAGDSKSWGSWTKLGGSHQAITSAKHHDGRLAVFAVGADNRLSSISQTAPGKGWGAWANLGGAVVQVSAEPSADGAMQVLAIGTDGGVWQIGQSKPNAGWSDWTKLPLDVTSLPGGATIDLPVRVLNGEPLSDDSAAHLLDWDASAEVEVGNSQVEVSYTLINAAERDRPAEEQTTFCPALRGTGGVLGLRCEGLREDVDLLVRATPVVDDAEQWFAADVLSTTVLLRVRPNPAVPVALVEPLLNPASEALLWVGEEALPSQASVTYSAWRLPLQPEDWDCAEAAETGTVCTPRLPAPPPPSAPADAGWSGRGQPQTGTDGEVSRGIDGRLRLSLGPAEADAVLAVVASKWHNPGPLANPDAPGVASATVLQPLVAQLIRPDPERRLALVANGRGYGLVGGEPGTFYTLQRPADGATVGAPMYVPQRTSADPPTNWGLGWQRLNRDMVVASDAGPGFDGRPHVTELQRAVVEARRAFSGATIQMRRKALVVIPLNMGTVCRIMVWGLAPEERITLLRVGSQPPPQPISKAGVKDGSVGLDIRGPVPADTEVTLEISQEGSDQRWSFTARLFTPRTSAP